MDTPTTHRDRTLPLSVANTGFLLDRLGEDCHPLQFLRELTQNSIEAIARTSEASGEVVWDVDWNYYDLQGVFKLCVIDNGDGMTGPEMVKYINQLSSSFSQQSLAGNYGVGAKVAAATRNHAGLIYLSWKHGQGSMVHLWRNPDTQEYGLRQLQRPDGSYGHYAAVEDDVRPALIREHGTMVLLLGSTEESDTVSAPEGASSPSRWVSKYLNGRYYSLPAGVTIRAREGWLNPREDRDRNVLRRVVGQQEYLQSHSEAHGELPVTGAMVRWWILSDDKALSQNSGFIESSGHVAALYNGELYEMSTGRAGMSQLQQFGIILGHRRVVIYVEPETGKLRRLSTNTARTSLLMDSAPLPWAQWAIEFREKMPEEIRNLIDEVAARSKATDHSNTIRERLRSILDLYRISRYRPTPTGTSEVDEVHTVRGGIPRRGAKRQRSTPARAGSRGGTAGGVYSIFLKKNGTRAEKIKPDPFPEVRWISVSDGTRESGDLEDRAARYLIDQNRLLVNADFRVFEDMVDRWATELSDRKAPRSLVEDAVRAWFEQNLVETVLGVQALRNAQEWSIGDIDKALSEEALTSAVMPRYHVNIAIKRELGSKFGRIATAS